MTEDPKEIEPPHPLPGEDEAMVPAERLFAVQAESLRVQNRLDEAIETLKQGIERLPEYLPGRLLLGRCYLEKGMHEEAKVELEKVSAMIEECLPVYNLLSKVYVHERKDVDKALEAVRRALYFTSQEVTKKKLTPMEMGLSSPPMGANLSPSASASDPNEKKGSAFDPRTKAARQAIQTDTLAEIYIKQGKMEKALSIYREILTQDPNQEAVRTKYKAVLKKMEKRDEAKARERAARKLEAWLAKVSSSGDAS
jgi:predicted Zn-dependent protease